MFFLVLKILITLSVILRHLEAELSILRCLKLIRGVISTYRKKNNKLKKLICYPPNSFLAETLWPSQLTSWQQRSSRITKKLFGPVSWDLHAEIIKTRQAHSIVTTFNLFTSSQSDFHHNFRPDILHTRKAGFFLVNCFITNPKSTMPPKKICLM
jgi:hypothetical protein